MDLMREKARQPPEVFMTNTSQRKEKEYYGKNEKLVRVDGSYAAET